jgi:hypothetical protein
MRAMWASRQENLLSDCVVSPHVFDHLLERLDDFVVPYQHALETETGQRNVHLSTVNQALYAHPRPVPSPLRPH